MRRREFIAIATSGIAAWPLVARAQQVKLFRLGFLYAGTRSDPTVQNLRREFILGLRDLGYVEDRHFKLDERYAEGGQLDRLPALAAELVGIPVDIIATSGEAAILAAKVATEKIPIVMLLSSDPISSGFIASLPRPGGNVTGMSSLAAELAGKRVELLKELVPSASRIAVIWNPSNQSKVVEWKDTQAAAKTLGVTLHSAEVRAPDELDAALTSIERERTDAAIVFTESTAMSLRDKIAAFVQAHRLPMICATRDLVVVAGLASYGASRGDLWRRGASHVDKIVRGAKPADLPVEQPTRFELVINLNTAKALGLTVPASVLARADEVIE